MVKRKYGFRQSGMEVAGFGAVTLFLSGILFFLVRFYLCLPSQKTHSKAISVSGPVSCMIIFGSGGHTTEMIRTIQQIDIKKYSPMYFVIAHVSICLPLSLCLPNSFCWLSQSDHTSIGKIKSSQVS